MLTQGDIVIINFPFSDLSGSKPRPAIIVSSEDVNNTPDVILAAITSTIRNDEFSFLLDDSMVSTSLGKTCEVRCHKLFTCDQSQIQRPISTLSATQLSILAKKVKQSFSTI